MAIYVASEPAGEVEDGLVDLIVARPVPRFLIVTRSAFVFAVGSAAIVAAMFATSRIVVHWLSPATASAFPAVRLAWVAANLLAIVWCFGAASLAVASRVRQRTRAAGAVALVAVSLYLLQFGAAAWTPLRPFARVSPFHYYEPMQTLLGGVKPVTYLLGLLDGNDRAPWRCLRAVQPSRLVFAIAISIDNRQSQSTIGNLNRQSSISIDNRQS